MNYAYADLHCDTLYAAWRHGARDLSEVSGAMAGLDEVHRGGCGLQIYAIFMAEPDTDGFPGDEEYIRLLHEIFSNTMRDHGDIIARAESMADIARNAAAGKTSAMLSMEDGRAVQGNPENLRRFYDMGVRVMGLTWNAPNCFGFPNSTDAEEMGKGLTAFGKEAIPLMEEVGMVVDVSHLSDGGFWDVARLAKKPFIASHSNCRALNPHPRSLTDDMIRALADRGGVMGLNFLPGFLTADTEETHCSVDALAAQLRHRINTGGLGCAAIGTDFDGISGTFEIPSAGHMPELFDGLLKRGFTPYELDCISFRNVERVFRDTIG